MTDRKKDCLFLAALLVLLVLFFSKILFTDKIIRAPDIINEFYWWVKGMAGMAWGELFRVNLSSAGWDPYINSGFTNEGGTRSLHFLAHLKLIFKLIPAPASVAWCIVLHLFAGAAGVYFLCRSIGTGRGAAFLGGAVFALAPEIATLINAGHVMKIATIAYAPWAFLFLERGYQTRRVVYFLAAGLVLAFQFFNTHWQIAFYTCLCIGAYGVVRTLGMLREQSAGGGLAAAKLAALNLTVLFFFLTTVAISLAPLASWSTETTRGVASGANQGKGGLAEEEAMSWSLPPEELLTFVVPGMFGLSRQEAGENPPGIAAYYWGRMVFTQTSDYLGLLPWLLLPLPLIFRRDRYTWLAVAGVVGGILFSMGKYTPFYRLLFDYFPGIDHFRVPKMMMFIPVLGLGVLAARGLDLLLDEEVRATRGFARYLAGVLALPLLLLLLLGIEVAGRDYWLSSLAELIGRPTRYQEGAPLVAQRWNGLLVETGIAVFMAAAYAVALYVYSRRWFSATVLPAVLLLLFVADVGRVNAKFLFLVDEPDKAAGGKTPVMEYLLAHGSMSYRTLPMNGTDPMQYAVNRIPVMFTANPVQPRRWQEFLDAFSFDSSMPDMVNLKYLVYEPGQYEREKAVLGDRYLPVYRAPDGKELLLENRSVLPKAWLVPSAVAVADPGRLLAVLRQPDFDPRRTALVESGPPLPLDDPRTAAPFAAGSAEVTSYQDEHIVVTARPTRNALLVLGEKHQRGWRALLDGEETEIHPVNHILRGVYLKPGAHRVEFVFDPLPFRIGKWLTLASFCLFAVMLGREVWIRRARG